MQINEYPFSYDEPTHLQIIGKPINVNQKNNTPVLCCLEDTRHYQPIEVEIYPASSMECIDESYTYIDSVVLFNNTKSVHVFYKLI